VYQNLLKILLVLGGRKLYVDKAETSRLRCCMSGARACKCITWQAGNGKRNF